MTTNNQQEQLPKPVKERDTKDLLELVCQLHSRALNFPSKEMHDAYVEARNELESRLEPYTPPVEDGKQVGDVVNSIVRIMLDSEMIGYDENMKPQSRQGHLNRTQYRSVAEKIASIKSITWE